jgi:hypothetical protein
MANYFYVRCVYGTLHNCNVTQHYALLQHSTVIFCSFHPVKLKLFLCLTNWALRHEGVWESGGFLEVGTSWRWVVSFTPRPLYHGGKYPQYPLGRRLCGTQNRSGFWGQEKNLALPEPEFLPLVRPARSQSVYRLHQPGSSFHPVVL